MSGLNQAQPFSFTRWSFPSLHPDWLIVALTVLYWQFAHWKVLFDVSSADIKAFSLAWVIYETSLAPWIEYFSWYFSCFWFSVLFVLGLFLLTYCAVKLGLGWVEILPIWTQNSLIRFTHHFCKCVFYFALFCCSNISREFLKFLWNFKDLLALFSVNCRNWIDFDHKNLSEEVMKRIFDVIPQRKSTEIGLDFWE